MTGADFLARVGGMSRLLTDEEIERQLGDLPGWTRDGDGSRRATRRRTSRPRSGWSTRSPSRPRTWTTTPTSTSVGARVKFVLSTHSEGGLTQLDIELAHRVAQAAAPAGGDPRWLRPWRPTSSRTRARRTAQGIGARLNWLRAGVLGANDGIVSTAGIVIGVAARHRPSAATIATAGHRRAGRGRDEHGRRRVRLGEHPARHRAGAARQGAPRAAREPEDELAELTRIYRGQGADPRPRRARWPDQLTAHDALGAHAEAELGIDPRRR